MTLATLAAKSGWIAAPPPPPTLLSTLAAIAGWVAATPPPTPGSYSGSTTDFISISDTSQGIGPVPVSPTIISDRLSGAVSNLDALSYGDINQFLVESSLEFTHWNTNIAISPDPAIHTGKLDLTGIIYDQPFTTTERYSLGTVAVAVTPIGSGCDLRLSIWSDVLDGGTGEHYPGQLLNATVFPREWFAMASPNILSLTGSTATPPVFNTILTDSWFYSAIHAPPLNFQDTMFVNFTQTLTSIVAVSGIGGTVPTEVATATFTGVDIGPWKTTGKLPQPLASTAACTTADGLIFVAGGWTMVANDVIGYSGYPVPLSNKSIPTNGVWSASIDAAGNVSAWQAENSIPGPTDYGDTNLAMSLAPTVTDGVIGYNAFVFGVNPLNTNKTTQADTILVPDRSDAYMAAYAGSGGGGGGTALGAWTKLSRGYNLFAPGVATCGSFIVAASTNRALEPSGLVQLGGPTYLNKLAVSVLDVSSAPRTDQVTIGDGTTGSDTLINDASVGIGDLNQQVVFAGGTGVVPSGTTVVSLIPGTSFVASHAIDATVTAVTIGPGAGPQWLACQNQTLIGPAPVMGGNYLIDAFGQIASGDARGLSFGPWAAAVTPWSHVPVDGGRFSFLQGELAATYKQPALPPIYPIFSFPQARGTTWNLYTYAPMSANDAARTPNLESPSFSGNLPRPTHAVAGIGAYGGSEPKPPPRGLYQTQRNGIDISQINTDTNSAFNASVNAAKAGHCHGNWRNAIAEGAPSGGGPNTIMLVADRDSPTPPITGVTFSSLNQTAKATFSDWSTTNPPYISINVPSWETAGIAAGTADMFNAGLAVAHITVEMGDSTGTMSYEIRNAYTYTVYGTNQLPLYGMYRSYGEPAFIAVAPFAQRSLPLSVTTNRLDPGTYHLVIEALVDVADADDTVILHTGAAAGPAGKVKEASDGKTTGVSGGGWSKTVGSQAFYTLGTAEGITPTTGINGQPQVNGLPGTATPPPSEVFFFGTLNTESEDSFFDQPFTNLTIAQYDLPWGSLRLVGESVG